jgi:hypothetical protein
MKTQSLFFGLFLVAILVILIGLAQRITAQETPKNYYELFLDLQEQMNQDANLQIAIRLHTPIVEDENVFIVPDFDASDNITRVLSEIGEDYVCFNVLGGSARFTECVPFSNIASIRWLE